MSTREAVREALEDIKRQSILFGVKPDDGYSNIQTQAIRALNLLDTLPEAGELLGWASEMTRKELGLGRSAVIRPRRTQQFTGPVYINGTPPSSEAVSGSTGDESEAELALRSLVHRSTYRQAKVHCNHDDAQEIAGNASRDAHHLPEFKVALGVFAALRRSPVLTYDPESCVACDRKANQWDTWVFVSGGGLVCPDCAPTAKGLVGEKARGLYGSPVDQVSGEPVARLQFAQCVDPPGDLPYDILAESSDDFDRQAIALVGGTFDLYATPRTAVAESAEPEEHDPLTCPICQAGGHQEYVPPRAPETGGEEG